MYYIFFRHVYLFESDSSLKSVTIKHYKSLYSNASLKKNLKYKSSMKQFALVKGGRGEEFHEFVLM